MKLVNRNLYALAKDAILQMIDEKYSFMDKLPAESELSELLGVSRGTIREALRSLENDGIVISRHGVGTFVIRKMNSINCNISVLESSTTIIKRHGYEPGTKSVITDVRMPPGYVAKAMNLAPGKEVFYIERVRTADRVPVVYVEDYLPLLPKIHEKYIESSAVSLAEFLEGFGIVMGFSDCSISSVISTPRHRELLELTTPQALTKLQQTHYSTKGTIVLYSNSYFLSEKFEFSLIRKAN